MLKYTDSNLFDSPAQTLVNTVNTVGVMGKGIALEFKRRYPEMFKRYKKHCESGHLKVGMLYLYKTDHHWVLNFPTKQHWKRPSKPEWIEKGLQKFVREFLTQGITSVSFPQLGCGNGGLDWEAVVKPMMEKHLAKLPIPVYIHVARPDTSFEPEHRSKSELRDFRKDLQQLREPIGFPRFFEDVQRAAGQTPTPLPDEPKDPDEVVPLPMVQVPGEGIGLLQLPGDDFAELWHTLTSRRAVARSELPGELSNHSDVVMQLLLQLDYVEPMRIEHEDAVRFAPRPAHGNLVAHSRES